MWALESRFLEICLEISSKRKLDIQVRQGAQTNRGYHRSFVRPRPNRQPRAPLTYLPCPLSFANLDIAPVGIDTAWSAVLRAPAGGARLRVEPVTALSEGYDGRPPPNPRLLDSLAGCNRIRRCGRGLRCAAAAAWAAAERLWCTVAA
jgi:hypothetical protein